MSFFKNSDLEKWKPKSDSEALRSDWETVGKSLSEVMGLNVSKQSNSNSQKNIKRK